MAFFRWMIGLPVAAVVTAALFFIMAGLISQDNTIIADPTPIPEWKILAEIEDAAIDRTPPKPPMLKDPPPDTVIPKTLPGPKPTPSPAIPDKGAIDTPTPGPGPIGAPAITFPPQYPEACRSRSAEGDVAVQFDVTPEGNVVNIRIIESADPCFNRTVRNTVAKWKYPPAVQNDRAVMRYGVIERFSFKLVE